MDNHPLKIAEAWGRVFEIAVQRGVLAYLLASEILLDSHPQLDPWKTTKVIDISQGILKEMEITDPNAKEWIESGIRHLLVFGYGLGWSILREWMQHNKGHRYQIAALWCPLTRPGVHLLPSEERENTAKAFEIAFDLPKKTDLSLVDIGKPARADFILWLTPKSNSNRRKPSKDPDLILCLEFSYNAHFELEDYRQEKAHRGEIARYARYLESRGVFSRVCAEVQGENLSIDPNLSKHLMAFSSQDKPLYKLCQAASYSQILVKILQQHQRFSQPCRTTALAVTSNGLESLSALYNAQPPDTDPRVKLMQSLGEAYRNIIKINREDPEALNKEIKIVFNRLINSLPSDFRQQAKGLTEQPPLGQGFQLKIQETVEDFYQPMELMPLENALKGIEVTPALEQFFGGNAREKIENLLENRATNGQLPLREIHAGAIVSGLENTKVGEMRVIALEGNPGIGKTTAIIKFLSQHQEGYCFFYVSPRVVINRDVTATLAENGRQNQGILTITSNAQLINAAPFWYAQKEDKNPQLKPDCAVVIEGYDPLNVPESNILFLTPEQEQEIEMNIIAPRRYKKRLSEREDHMKSHHRPGVLNTIATAARTLLGQNPNLERLVMTAAIQGYRSLKQGSTVKALSKLFKHSSDSKIGQQEREKFAQKIPTIIVMVDEVAGDAAGALFCHQLANWLRQEFFMPFEGGVSPFRVVLIISDASLSNEIVLDRYLNAGEKSPDKVLISPSPGNIPFRVTGTYLKVGTGKSHPTLHIMTNSFPASHLTIDYQINLSSVTPEIEENGQLQTLRKAIRKQKEYQSLISAGSEIEKAITQGAEQVIFFAQDKVFLRELRQYLLSQLSPDFSPHDIEVLDQSTPYDKRLKLIQEPLRDQVRIFLMTSSGSRGVSFPKADYIIASIPRFNLESSLMEVAQLIYRGRGRYTDPITGEKVSGDAVNRHLVMLIEDFLPVYSKLKNDEHDPDYLYRRWLRQSSDLLTLLVMLRATIHTRIKGDAGLKKRRIAFVPVGMIKEQEILNLISDDLMNFLQEAQVFISDKVSKELKEKVGQGRKLVEDLFSWFDLRGISEQTYNVSYTDYGTLERLTKNVSRFSSKLLLNPQDEESQIPKNICCLGPFWFEDWSDKRSEEQFNFQGWNQDRQQQISHLLALLSEIYNHPQIPLKVKKPAKELYLVLSRDHESRTQEYATLQSIDTNALILALPLDYPHFWHKQGANEEDQEKLEAPAQWQMTLGRCLSERGVIMPIIPRYQDFPWVAIAGQSNLTQLALLFDHDYFVASYELNLLNTLLLEQVKD